jgi:hypothetical protein
MSYRVISDHVESLHDGRFVADGDSVSDADAKKNPRLVSRGVLQKEPDKRKPRAETAAGRTSAPEPPNPEENEEESK